MPAIDPPRIILMGASGTGKSHSIHTLAKAGLEVFAVITEPTGLETYVDVWLKEKLDPNLLRYAQIGPSSLTLKELEDVAKIIAVSDTEAISKLRPSGNRLNGSWFKLLTLLSNFKDDRTGKEFGPVDSFADNRVVVIDSFSGLNVMAWQLAVGSKPAAHPGEWQVMQNTVETFLNMLSALRCPSVLTAHIDPEPDPITGVTKIMVATLGKKLAPRVPRFFSEVVHSKKEGAKFTWSTTTIGMDLKNRSLPLSDGLPPDFGPIIDAYRKRKEFTQAA